MCDLGILSDAGGVDVTRDTFHNQFAVYIKVTNKASDVFRVGSAGTSGNVNVTYNRFIERNATKNPQNLSEELNRWKSIWVLRVGNGEGHSLYNGYTTKRSLECYKALAIEAFLIGQFARKYHFLDQSIFIKRQTPSDADAFARELIDYANGFSKEIAEIIAC
jgi:hypothetical protein